jgi:threo-3-hydroxy-L-aspartate ammonia-lyase
MNDELDLIGLEDVQGAAAAIRGAVRETPVVPVSSDEEWRHLWLKCENLQVIGAFKPRGALAMMLRVPRERLQAGVVTYSSGNHGQAVSWAARRLGVPATVVMPTTASPVKVEGVRRLGGAVHVAGTLTTERLAAAERLRDEHDLVMVPPFDHPDIIAGQGTVGLEIVAQLPTLVAVYVPMGGGGLVAGVAAAVKGLRPNVRVIGVEPAGAPKMSRSLEAGHPVTLERVRSIADGLLAVRPGNLPFAHVRSLVDDIAIVDDEELREAMRWLALDAKLVVEPSGVASVAAARRLAGPGTAGLHVAVVSGGNVRPELLAEVLRERA